MQKEPPIEFDRDEFLKERRAMLLSLDVKTCRAYARKWGGTVPTLDGTVLWAMHMARTAAQDIPAIERRRSKQWLIMYARPRGQATITAQIDDRDSARKDRSMLKLDWIEGPLADDEYSAYALLDEVKYESYRLRVVQWESGTWIGYVTYHANRNESFDAVKKKNPDVESAKAWCETALTALMLVGTELAIEEDQ